MTLNFLFLGTVLYRKLTGFSLTYLGKGVVKILLASMIMGAGVFGLKIVFQSMLASAVPLQLVAVFGMIGAAALLYGATLHLLNLPELKVITDKMLCRFRR